LAQLQVLGIIPAREGSKRLKGKNKKMFLGAPLISYTLEESIKSHLTDVIVTTDDIEIIQIVNNSVMVDWRPDLLCTDTANIKDTISRITELYPKYDAYMLLQPTSPLRTHSHINKAIDLYIKKGAEVMSVCKGKTEPNGAIYLFSDIIRYSVENLMEMSEEDSVDIDTLDDFQKAEVLYVKKNAPKEEYTCITMR
jgi:CMP-N-acetylneuraminic acid synthetase